MPSGLRENWTRVKKLSILWKEQQEMLSQHENKEMKWKL
jgi:hypothetical protein